MAIHIIVKFNRVRRPIPILCRLANQLINSPARPGDQRCAGSTFAKKHSYQLNSGQALAKASKVPCHVAISYRMFVAGRVRQRSCLPTQGLVKAPHPSRVQRTQETSVLDVSSKPRRSR
jgi:hypothetical protein